VYYIQSSFYLGTCSVLYCRSFGVTADTALVSAIAVFYESGLTFCFSVLRFIITFYCPYLRKVLER
jgi:hypothetical protein